MEAPHSTEAPSVQTSRWWFFEWLKEAGVLDICDMRFVFGDDGLYINDVRPNAGVCLSEATGEFSFYSRTNGIVEPTEQGGDARAELERFLWEKARLKLTVLPNRSLVFFLDGKPQYYVMRKPVMYCGKPQHILVPKPV
jgi:hypothetical protein